MMVIICALNNIVVHNHRCFPVFLVLGPWHTTQVLRPSYVPVPEPRTRNLEAMEHVLFCSVQVSGTRQIWCQNARHISKVTGTRFLVPVGLTWTLENLDRVPWALQQNFWKVVVDEF